MWADPWAAFLAWYAGNAWRWADPPDDLYRHRAAMQAMLEVGWTMADELTPALQRTAEAFSALARQMGVAAAAAAAEWVGVPER